MLLKQAGTDQWKRWAAKPEVEELKGGSVAGANPSRAAKGRLDESWTHEHRQVRRNLLVEEGWVQKKTVRHWLVR